MFDRIATGWELATESFAVLRKDTRLLLFPLISGICCLLVLASFAVPLWSTRYFEAVFNDENGMRDPLSYAIVFAFYAVNYFVIVYFNAALVACALIRFKGGEPTIGDGLRAATNRLPQILAWALVSATVGTILRAIESHSERLGQFISGLLGAGWSIATFFVVPVLVTDRVGPIEAVQRSFAVLRKTWGEALSANFGIGIVTFGFIFLFGLLPLMAGGYALAAGQAVAGVALMATAVGAMLVISLVSSALDSILLAALYLYAAEGRVPGSFDSSLFRSAFGEK
jgi:Family of unknown function (DUF6159)